ncbi:probable G-protein coupled receptor 142 [Paramacrobiotus metropolitanus]|uniref:probable G-protein coupled receptor 142 n=1 Tax=Paramacrobiotus metropolitanus TaxID=2943436 RepID=UPI002445F798|nr:probable G-protein coupled receptor 142 [Paramacrobiotus metropolitanus]
MMSWNTSETIADLLLNQTDSPASSVVRDKCGWIPAYGRVQQHPLRLLDIYSYPFLLFLATLGNIINLMVLTKDKPFASKSIYLIALAAMDMLYMWCALLYYVTGFARETEILNIYLDSLTVIGEQISGVTGFFQEIVNTASTWLIIAFTIERFAAIKFPLWHLRHCHSRRGTLILTAILTLAALFAVKSLVRHYWYYHHFLRYQPPPAQVPPYPPLLATWYNGYQIARNLNQMTAFLVILVLNGWLVISVARQQRFRRESLHAAESNRSHIDWGALGMLTACVSLYLITQTPAFVNRILELLHHHCIRERSYVTRTILAYLQNFLLNVNYSSNFIVYCGTNPKFRLAVRRLFVTPGVAILRKASQDVTKVTGSTRFSRANSDIRSLLMLLYKEKHVDMAGSS